MASEDLLGSVRARPFVAGEDINPKEARTEPTAASSGAPVRKQHTVAPLSAPELTEGERKVIELGFPPISDPLLYDAHSVCFKTIDGYYENYACDPLNPNEGLTNTLKMSKPDFHTWDQGGTSYTSQVCDLAGAPVSFVGPPLAASFMCLNPCGTLSPSLDKKCAPDTKPFNPFLGGTNIHGATTTALSQSKAIVVFNGRAWISSSTGADVKEDSADPGAAEFFAWLDKLTSWCASYALVNHDDVAEKLYRHDRPAGWFTGLSELARQELIKDIRTHKNIRARYSENGPKVPLVTGLVSCTQINKSAKAPGADAQVVVLSPSSKTFIAGARLFYPLESAGKKGKKAASAPPKAPTPLHQSVYDRLAEGKLTWKQPTIRVCYVDDKGLLKTYLWPDTVPFDMTRDLVIVPVFTVRVTYCSTTGGMPMRTDANLSGVYVLCRSMFTTAASRDILSGLRLFDTDQ